MHLVEGFAKIRGVDELSVLNFEEVITAMAIHVDEKACLRASKHLLVVREVVRESSSEQVEDGRLGNVVLFVIDFDVVA